MKTVLYGVAAALAAFLAPAAGAAEIKVIASNAVREPYRELNPIFEKEAAHKVTVDWGGTVDVVKRVGGGDVADIVIIPNARIDDFVAQGKLVGRIDLARSGVGVAVRAGAPKPDISTVEALRNALLAAKSIILSSGPSSIYLPTLFEKMGISGQLEPKITQIGSRPRSRRGDRTRRRRDRLHPDERIDVGRGHSISRPAAGRGSNGHRVFRRSPRRRPGRRRRPGAAEIPDRAAGGAGPAAPRHGAGVRTREDAPERPWGSPISADPGSSPARCGRNCRPASRPGRRWRRSRR
jgi:Bacterial extracellular solute-binding protein